MLSARVRMTASAKPGDWASRRRVLRSETRGIREPRSIFEDEYGCYRSDVPQKGLPWFIYQGSSSKRATAELRHPRTTPESVESSMQAAADNRPQGECAMWIGIAILLLLLWAGGFLVFHAAGFL